MIPWQAVDPEQDEIVYTAGEATLADAPALAHESVNDALVDREFMNDVTTYRQEAGALQG